MLILGLLLAAAALVVFGYMLFGTRDLEPLRIDLGVFAVELTPMHLYLLGAATLVVLVLGLFFLTLGLRAQRRRRREVKELRAAVRDGAAAPDRADAREAPAARGHRPDAPPASVPGDAPGGPIRNEPTAGPVAYERDVPGSRAGHAPPPPPPDGHQEVALPSDHGRDPEDRQR